ncbi:MAG: outer membrane lipoprotein carrier protein LolA [Bacteroidales bacterium]|nr:outer membrane lipoprotein carrier protein LolA [Bacteroidales bacterium]MCF8344458.1 outer membrane lipoprotein carrier protein LolA [Bacteroidales bacterium]MCF8350403.1 outer membrane lipoprotein carrier protein LolA [Bacteroidales bacterium]MCF8375286.1 outer membrane lipoprotein carrier protein LolA [Bacteroidales bacterium]MCF8400142.1 outer membrane lipoprotein carrier protein LolA [Bacteroidales bacterium]
MNTSKIKVLLTAFLMISLSVGFAQSRDKKATEILDAVVENTNSFENFKAEFVYTMVNEEAGLNESKEGKILVKGDQYVLELIGQMVICDGENIWTYIADDQEVMVNKLEESDESVTPSNLLNKYNEKYKSKYVGSEVRSDKNVHVIELKPEEGKTYSKIEVAIDQEENIIHDFTIFDKNGSVYSYEIINFEPNIDLPENAFTFEEEEYPDVDVIDMR